MNNRFIMGAGGGSKPSGSRVSVEAPNTLRSKSFANILDIVSVGEVEELPVGGAKGIYFNGVPAQNADGTYNVQGFSYEARPGTLRQEPLKIIDGIAASHPVGVELKHNQPIEKFVNSEFVDFARVIIAFQALVTQDPSTGDRNGTTVQHKIEYKPNNSSTWVLVPSQTGDANGIQTISGKTTSAYEREFAFRVEGQAPFTFRVTRITPDSSSDNLQNKSVFQAVSVVTQKKFSYPLTALVALSIDATQFSSIPTRTYLYKGLKVKVPDNYDPLTRTYNGVWLGGFVTRWTDNPAWCYRDFLTNEDYGLGERITEDMIDDGALYQIAQYCDQMVSDGQGGTEPRYTCNLRIDSHVDAYKLMQDMATMFGGIAYWAQGTLMPVQDRPRDTRYLFNNTNVINGTFSYTGSHVSTRYNAVTVTYNDKNTQYKATTEYVSDAAEIAKMGYVNETRLNCFGCTSRSQAVRAARRLIYTSCYETDLVSFQTGLEGVIPVPGDVIRVQDTLRASSRSHGRVVSSSGTTLTMDAPIEFSGTVNGVVAVIGTDGQIVEKNFTATGTTSTITLDSAFSAAIAEDSVFILSFGDIPEALFRVLSVTENEKFLYTVQAVTYNPDKYAMIDDGAALSALPTSTLVAPQIKNASASEVVYLDGVAYKSKILVSWTGSEKATSYYVNITRPDGSTVSQNTTAVSYELLDTPLGTYKVVVVATDVLGNNSQPFNTTVVVDGKIGPSTEVKNLAFSLSNGSGLLTWTRHEDMDVIVGGSIEIRHSASASPTWETGTFVATASGAATRLVVPIFKGTYMAKAVNKQGVYSDLTAFAASEYFTQGAVQNLVLDVPFTGLILAVKWDAYPAAREYTISLSSGGVVKKTITTTATRASYTLQELISWGLSRTVDVAVVATGYDGAVTLPATLTATKPQLPAPTISVQDTSESMIVTASQSNNSSYKATRIVISQANGFDPASVTPYYDGPQTAYPSGKIAPGMWYVRVAQYDLFGADSLNWTTQVSLTVLAQAKGVQSVVNAALITAAPGADAPGGENYRAVYDQATGRMATWDSATGTYKFAPKEGEVTTQINNAIAGVPNLEVITDLQAGLAQEVQDRVNGINAEAQARAQAILDEAAARQSAITVEQQLRQSADESLAQTIAQVSAGTGTQFDPAKIWYFDGSTDGWVGWPDAVTLVDGTWLRPGSENNSFANRDVQGMFSNVSYRFLSMRVKKVGNPPWAGFLQWQYVGDPGWSANTSIAEPTFSADGIASVEFDNIPWDATPLQAISLRVGAQSATDYYLIDWVAVGRPTPGAGVAALEEERQARISAVAAEASERNTLASQMRGAYAGSDLEQVTSGLLYQEKLARTTATTSLVQRTDNLEASFNNGLNTVNTRITNVETAASSASTANAQSISSLKASLPGAAAGELFAALKPGSDEGWVTESVVALPWGLADFGYPSNGNHTFYERDSYFGQVFRVTPGEIYHGAFDSVMTGGGTNNVTVSLGLAFYATSGGIFYWAAAATRPLNTPGGYHVEGDLTVPANAYYAILWVQIDGPGGVQFVPSDGKSFHGANFTMRRKARVGEVFGAATADALDSVSARVDVVDGKAVAATNRLDTLETNVSDGFTTANSRIDGVAGTVTTLEQTTANNLSQVQSSLNTSINTVDSRVTNLATTVSNGDQANALAIQQTAARLDNGGDIKSAIVQVQSQATATADLVAGTYSVQIDANGRVARIALIGSSNSSQFVIDADETIVSGSIKAKHLSAESVTAPKIQAGAVTADKISVNALSAISASLGTISSAILEMINGAGWQYIRTAGKWFKDGVGGWISAARPETGDYFQEFRASSGNALVVERKAGGPNYGGAQYYLHVRDSLNVDRLIIDPETSTYRLKGHIEADSGSFTGSVNSSSGSIGGNVIDADGLRSTNYVAGASGWKIGANGTAEFDRTSVRNPNVAASGTYLFNSGWVGGNKELGSEGSGRFYPGTFTALIDTGVTMPEGWATATSTIYGAGVTISGGSSQDGGTNGYLKTEMLTGDGLLSGNSPTVIENRIYLKVTWSWGGNYDIPNEDPGSILVTQLSWKLVKL